ncbi:MAG: sulfite exporter TauE/SafE family protein [Melioribacteraceae bacterium]|nr:sulfite exporter TauE/SafE family protein [Melioribacteraceae bacterium]
MKEIIILLIIGLTAGLASGVLGIGGGIVIIPMLIGFLGYTQKDAQGTSLGLLLLPIGILAVMNYYKAGHINLRAVGIMVITFVIGSYFSSLFAINLPEGTLKKIFAVFLFVYALKLFFEK